MVQFSLGGGGDNTTVYLLTNSVIKIPNWVSLKYYYFFIYWNDNIKFNAAVSNIRKI